MEDLNKQQLILLALLVSFVTSIAASIATASLLDQAPPKVTQTIHRVVERTVETVTPSNNGEPVVTEEKTVIVREEDAITETIALVSPHLVKLYMTVGAAENDEDESTTAELATRFLGLALVTDTTGTIVTTSNTIASADEETYEAVLNDGSQTSARVQQPLSTEKVTVLSLDTAAGVASLDPLVFGEDENLHLGQTALGIGGRTVVTVNIGIVSAIKTAEDDSVTSITANIASDTSGMPLVNLFGEIVGFAASAGTDTYIPASNIAAVIAE